MTPTLSATKAIDLLLSKTHAMLDVRSEGEFAKACIPGTQSSPILNDSERHAVGLCYKVRGQREAIDLGHKLVDPQREDRVAKWIKMGSSHADTPLLVCCWRGGMRSQFATEWIEAAGREALRIEGGYKAIRTELMAEFSKPKSFLVLSGKTGSGKTLLLKDLPIPDKIDIEDLAVHRGSSFGKIMDRDQPSQATFENALSLGLKGSHRSIVIEDESKVIGSLHLPEPFFQSMAASPIVQLEVSVADRSLTIFKEYVATPSQNIDSNRLESQLVESVAAIKRRLGGALTDKITKHIHNAFAFETQTFENHRIWIETLLVEYYDRAYEHFNERNQRNIAFTGNYEECREWIINQYA